jgi:protein gp37
MGQETRIEWCHHTFNPWRGCTKVSAGCAHCYAEAWSSRNPKVFGEWGTNGRRAIAAESSWREPLAWDREAALCGERRKVFCASLADVFEDRPDLVGPRGRLLATIAATPHLDWHLLTKRSEDVGRLAGGELPPSVWIGASVEDQAAADGRIPHLARIAASVRFLSVEPLLGPIDFPTLDGIAWAIVGGESGPGARPCDVGWIRSILEQCRSAGVAPFVKQLGARPLGLRLADRKGGDPAEWPEDLRVRESPRRGRGRTLTSIGADELATC